MNGVRFMLLTALFAIYPGGPVVAHSWYPRECCDDNDCTPADAISTDVRGDLSVHIGNRRVWVPKGFNIRPSRDDRIHVCFFIDEHNFLMPLCLFMPAQG